MTKRNKCGKILLAAIALIGFGAAGAAAQNYGNYIYIPVQKQDFQVAIEKATFHFWQDLGLALKGEYADTQKAYASSAKRTSKLITRDPQAFFSMPSFDLGKNFEQLSEEEKLAKYLEREVFVAAQMQTVLTRYNALQKAISENQEIFPGYVLVGKTDLTTLSEATMRNLLNLFGGTNSSNTPAFAFQEFANRIVISADQTTLVIVFPSQRHLVIISTK